MKLEEEIGEEGGKCLAFPAFSVFLYMMRMRMRMTWSLIVSVLRCQADIFWTRFLSSSLFLMEGWGCVNLMIFI